MWSDHEENCHGDCHLSLFDHAMEKIDQTSLINDLLFQLVYIYTVSKTQRLHVQYVDHINRMYIQYSSLTAATHERLMGTRTEEYMRVTAECPAVPFATIGVTRAFSPLDRTYTNCIIARSCF